VASIVTSLSARKPPKNFVMPSARNVIMLGSVVAC
jgi:hypothetical protein